MICSKSQSAPSGGRTGWNPGLLSPRLLRPVTDVHPTASKGCMLCAHCHQGPVRELKVTHGNTGQLQSTLPACLPSPRGRSQASFPETPAGSP